VLIYFCIRRRASLQGLNSYSGLVFRQHLWLSMGSLTSYEWWANLQQNGASIFFLPECRRRKVVAISPNCPAHRNLITIGRMHLCMQDDEIGRKFMWLTSAYMAFNQYKQTVFGSQQPSPTAGTTPILNLSCFTRKIVHFWLDIRLLGSS
jgi:hypothetical protein